LYLHFNIQVQVVHLRFFNLVHHHHNLHIVNSNNKLNRLLLHKLLCLILQNRHNITVGFNQQQLLLERL